MATPQPRGGFSGASPDLGRAALEICFPAPSARKRGFNHALRRDQGLTKVPQGGLLALIRHGWAKTVRPSEVQASPLAHERSPVPPAASAMGGFLYSGKVAQVKAASRLPETLLFSSPDPPDLSQILGQQNWLKGRFPYLSLWLPAERREVGMVPSGDRLSMKAGF